MPSPTLLDAALSYAARGWRVFPLHTTLSGKCSCGRACGRDAGKHPRTRKGVKDASTDPEQIRKWWARWSEANIGVATGFVRRDGPAGGLIVVDLDGLAQVEQFKALAGPHDGFPLTLTARTGRGFHLYLAGELAGSRTIDGLLVRGEGGYVVAPPSLHASGKRYQWVRGDSLSVAPSWFMDWLQTSGGTKVTVESLETLLGPRPAYLGPKREDKSEGSGENLAAQTLRALAEPWTAQVEARIKAALATIPASCKRDTWLAMGMALHSLHWERPDGTDAGEELWRDWSATCPEKFSEHDVETRWRSFGRREGVTIASLFGIAREHGWDGQIPLKSESGGEAGSLFGTEVNGNHALPAILTAAPAPIFVDLAKGGAPLSTCTNTAIAIRALNISCAHDTFHDKLILGGQVITEWAGDLSDNTLQMLRVLIRRAYGFDPGLQHAHDATVQECLQHAFDPVQDYLDGLVWDRQPRLAQWLPTYMGAEDSPLNREIGKLALCAAVRRARSPGCKFDEITVLESPEGFGKSSAIEVLAGADNYSDQTILTLDDKAQQEAVQGIWLYEIADLAGMHRADVEKIKTFASRKVDRARPAYGRVRMDKPRRCVFFATTNDLTYLKSQTGNRRFWPVRVGRARLQELARDRDQLWAEAAMIESGAVPLGLAPAFWGAAGTLQDERRDHDPWEDVLSGIQIAKKHLTPDGRNDEWRVSTRDILDLVLRLPIEKQVDSTAKRVAFIMRRLGWDGPKQLREGENKIRGYTKPV